MTVLDAIKTRFSVRRYQSAPLAEDDLSAILEAARFSQSAKNRQEWRLIVVRDGRTRERLAVAAKEQAFVAAAPAIIVCCGVGLDYVMTCGQPSYPIDIAIAMENMALAAWERGVGSCWLGAFHEDQVKNILGIPEDGVRVTGMLTLGYPAMEAPVRNRLPLGETVRFERW